MESFKQKVSNRNRGSIFKEVGETVSISLYGLRSTVFQTTRFIDSIGEVINNPLELSAIESSKEFEDFLTDSTSKSKK